MKSKKLYPVRNREPGPIRDLRPAKVERLRLRRLPVRWRDRTQSTKLAKWFPARGRSDRLALLNHPGFLGIVPLNAHVAFRPIKQVTDGGGFPGGWTKAPCRRPP